MQQLGVLRLEFGDGARVAAGKLVPEIIHADENAQDVGLQRDGIHFPSRLQCRHVVAAHAAIEDPEPAVRVRAQHV